MGKFNLKVFLIDLGLSGILGFILMMGIYYIYEVFPNLPRIFSALLLFILIPFTWGNIIFSLLGKKSIGSIIVKNIK